MWELVSCSFTSRAFIIIVICSLCHSLISMLSLLLRRYFLLCIVADFYVSKLILTPIYCPNNPILACCSLVSLIVRITLCAICHINEVAPSNLNPPSINGHFAWPTSGCLLFLIFLWFLLTAFKVR